MKLVVILPFVVLIATLLPGQAPGDLDARLHLDHFGYLPAVPKIAVVASPQTGYNAPDPLVPDPIYRVKRCYDHVTVFSGPLSAWNGGATHGQSGDKVWHFDFSALTTAGQYYLYDSLNGLHSWPFVVSDCAYEAPLRAASRALYYQRCGMAKVPPYADSAWTDAAVCHRGNLQDDACRNIQNPTPASARDLHGGWHDAGDYNKYVTFTYGALIDLLLGFEENPAVWGDDNGIPESGNGVPDLLDEIQYELDWLRRMQQPNGSVLCVVGVQNFASASPPGADAAQRFYGPATTAATLSVAATFALAARQFETIPALVAYADTLEAAAVAAWNWANANPNVTFYNSGVIAAGENEVDDYERGMRKLAAACFLFARTGNTTYRTYFNAHYQEARLMQWGYAYPFETATQDALLFYSKIPNATVSVKNSILNTYAASLETNNEDNLPAFLNNEDAYRAFLRSDNYTWGSNTTKSHQGNMFFSMNHYGLDGSNAANYRDAALGFAHYLHGVNPTGYCYLSNMGAAGGEASLPTIYHAWFGDGTPWDDLDTPPHVGPAPGFIAGGANPNFQPDPACNCTLAPPQNQPVQKSFKAWNTGWPQNSWELTEPGIYTQAAYIRLIGLVLQSQNDPPDCDIAPVVVMQGAENVCADGSYDYWVIDVPGSTYVWTVTGGVILSGQGTAGITVRWDNGPTAGTVSLTQTFP